MPTVTIKLESGSEVKVKLQEAQMSRLISSFSKYVKDGEDVLGRFKTEDAGHVIIDFRKVAMVVTHPAPQAPSA